MTGREKRKEGRGMEGEKQREEGKREMNGEGDITTY